MYVVKSLGKKPLVYTNKSMMCDEIRDSAIKITVWIWMT